MRSASSSATPSLASQRYSRAAAISRRTAISSASATRASAAARSTRCWLERHGRGSPRACRRSGQAHASHRGMLHIGSIALDATRAEPWRPASWPSARRPESVARALRRLERFAAEQAPVDGLARVVLGTAGDRVLGSGADSAAARAALARLADRRRSASGRFAGARPRPDAVGRRCSVWDARGVACGRAGRHGRRALCRACRGGADGNVADLRRVPACRGRGAGLRGPACRDRCGSRGTGRRRQRSRRGFGPHRPHLGLGCAGRSHARLAGIRLNAKAACRSRMGADLRVSSTRWSVARAGSLRRREFGGSG